MNKGEVWGVKYLSIIKPLCTMSVVMIIPQDRRRSTEFFLLMRSIGDEQISLGNLAAKQGCQRKSLSLTLPCPRSTRKWRDTGPFVRFSCSINNFLKWIVSSNRFPVWRTRRLLRQVSIHWPSGHKWTFGLIGTALDSLFGHGRKQAITLRQGAIPVWRAQTSQTSEMYVWFKNSIILH